ncbi:MAG: kduD, partial [Desertimonas sp.]|nr:kduD [Desertimonas sp.]
MSDGIGPLFSLQGRTALVTGGSRGIGRALAVGLAAAGADVVLTSRGEVAETAAEIATLDRRVDIVDVDLSDVDSVRDTASALVAERQIDILVNNAGVIDRNEALSITPEGWRGVLTVNVEALFFLTQAIAAPMLDRRAGKVINLASLLSFEGGLNVASYAASKHAVAGVTRALANEWAGRGVQVNAIAPGYIA